MRRARRKMLAALRFLGAPSVLRRGSILFRSYWHLMGVLDRMLASPGLHPAISLGKLPTGPRRQLRTALRGGWLGSPTPVDRWLGRRRVAPALAAVDPDLPVTLAGLDLAAVIRPWILKLIQDRLGEDVAQARMLRRGLDPKRVRKVIGAYDARPEERLVVVIAREKRVPTLMVAHGAFFLPQPFPDLDYCDEVILWSWAIAPPISRLDRPIHEVGYPLPHRLAEPRRLNASSGPPRIVVLGQIGGPWTAAVGQRVTLRSYVTAVGAALRRFPGAQIVLRPHPAEDRATHATVRREFGAANLEVDGETNITALLEEVDLVIGGTSTAMMQAAVPGVPVVALNLSGFEWPWPIGGETSVPVARSGAELDAVLEQLAARGTVPGREDLLAALGASGTDTVGIIAQLATGPAVSTVRRPVSG